MTFLCSKTKRTIDYSKVQKVCHGFGLEERDQKMGGVVSLPNADIHLFALGGYPNAKMGWSKNSAKVICQQPLKVGFKSN